MSKLSTVLSQFPEHVVGSLVESTPIAIGLIHQTHRIQTSTGDFCLQRLHPKLATAGIAADYEAVLSHLGSQNFPAPTLCKTREGQNTWVDTEGFRWRLTTWIAGRSYNHMQSDAMAYSAAAMLGRFHRTMASIEYTFQSTHPLHDTVYHMEALQKAVIQHKDSPWKARIHDMVEAVEAELPELLLPSTIPQHVVHGDPKISNILFDEDHQAIGIIDLDTCTRHSLLVDLGDAIRSWSKAGTEDQQLPFSIERFRAIVEGYASTGPQLQASEIEKLADAGRHITLELTARFLTDVLEDSYFAWDATQYASRKEHNFARSCSMYTLAQQMKVARPALQDIVESVFNA